MIRHFTNASLILLSRAPFPRRKRRSQAEQPGYRRIPNSPSEIGNFNTDTRPHNYPASTAVMRTNAHVRTRAGERANITAVENGVKAGWLVYLEPKR